MSVKSRVSSIMMTSCEVCDSLRLRSPDDATVVTGAAEPCTMVYEFVSPVASNPCWYFVTI